MSESIFHFSLLYSTFEDVVRMSMSHSGMLMTEIDRLLVYWRDKDN